MLFLSCAGVHVEQTAEELRQTKLVQTKLLEQFAAAVAQRGGVVGLRRALQFADTNGDGTVHLAFPSHPAGVD